jgi:hypothetical protein
MYVRASEVFRNRDFSVSSTERFPKDECAASSHGGSAYLSLFGKHGPCTKEGLVEGLEEYCDVLQGLDPLLGSILLSRMIRV